MSWAETDSHENYPGVRRVVGLETEYGVLDPENPTANATELSARTVNAYGNQVGSQSGQWDYLHEHPLSDARGWQVPRDLADPSQLTDGGSQNRSSDPFTVDDPHLVNRILSNGARLYVDHAHPEYSSPEVTNPVDAVIWDKAGEVIMAEAARNIASNPGLSPLKLYKNNTDGKGVSYGAHENYLMPRAVPFSEIAAGLIPFFTTRQIICGAGRVGIGVSGSEPGFQISQRADFFETEIGLETTIRRPIVNTRDEPHADSDQYRRLHVIIGDANQSEVSIYLKVGTTNLVLDLIESGNAPRIALADPVAALQEISHDPTLQLRVPLVGGEKLSAIEIQRLYLEAAQKRAAVELSQQDEMTQDVLQRWDSVLEGLERDPSSMWRDVEWVGKKRILDSFKSREGLSWDSPRLALIDLQWSDVSPEKSLFKKLNAKNQWSRIVTDEQIADAAHRPPEDTRAYFRGMCITKFSPWIAGASWDSVVFDIPGKSSLQRIPTLDPLKGTKRHVGSLLESTDDAPSLLQKLKVD